MSYAKMTKAQLIALIETKQSEYNDLMERHERLHKKAMDIREEYRRLKNSLKPQSQPESQPEFQLQPQVASQPDTSLASLARIMDFKINSNVTVNPGYIITQHLKEHPFIGASWVYNDGQLFPLDAWNGLPSATQDLLLQLGAQALVKHKCTPSAVILNPFNLRIVIDKGNGTRSIFADVIKIARASGYIVDHGDAF